MPRERSHSQKDQSVSSDDDYPRHLSDDEDSNSRSSGDNNLESPSDSEALEPSIEEEMISRFLDTNATFGEMANGCLDPRILQVISGKFGLKHPTLIQSKAIPFILEGKDVLLRARTGSGKTLAYAVPAMHNLLENAEECKSDSLRMCVFVPTRELCVQVSEVFGRLCEFCHSKITVQQTSEHVAKLAHQQSPTILVSTPKAFLTYVNLKSSKQRQMKTRSSSECLSALKIVVLDEADSMLTLGYKNDLESIFQNLVNTSRVGLPRHQTIFCSATLNADVDYLKSFTLYKPVILKLEDDEIIGNSGNLLQGAVSQNQLSEYYVSVPSRDKHLVLYSLLQLQLLPMKILIFANSSDKAYGISMFLEKFAIQSAVVCSSLPFSTRRNILNAFDQGLVEILIATEDSLESSGMEHDSTGFPESKQKDYGIHRGLDLQGIKCVVNFDLPKTVKGYLHRVGRTARGGSQGVALSLCGTDKNSDIVFIEKVSETMCGLNQKTSALKSLGLELKDVECFRYRVEDVMKSVTKRAIVTMRAHDLQRQILASKKLEAHFEAKPEDAVALSMAFKSLQGINPHMKHLQTVPSYFKPSLTKITQHSAVESAVRQLKEISTDQPRKNRPAVLKIFGLQKKKQPLSQMLRRQLNKEPDHSITAPDNLPAISANKLYRMRKKVPLKKPLRQPGQKKKRRFVVNKKK